MLLVRDLKNGAWQSSEYFAFTRYGTLHLDATKILADILHKRGQRSFVGKCNMDRHSAPDYTEKTASKSIEDTKEFVAYVREQCSSEMHQHSNGTLARTDSTKTRRHRSSTSSMSSSSSSGSRPKPKRSTSLVQPILTPRFAISCSDALMAGLQAMVGADPTLYIQTHLAENPAEIEFTKQLFPFTDSYTHGAQCCTSLASWADDVRSLRSLWSSDQEDNLGSLRAPGRDGNGADQAERRRHLALSDIQRQLAQWLLAGS